MNTDGTRTPQPSLLWEPRKERIDQEEKETFDPQVAVLTHRIASRVQLHQEANERVVTSLIDMERRNTAAIRQNPEIEPYLSEYFASARQSLIENTLRVLAEPPLDPEPPVRPPKPSRLRQIIKQRIIATHLRHVLDTGTTSESAKGEPPDGAA